MGKINLLDEKTSNKIAAGEVVERPASVVKELIENSIDANSTAITVEIKNGGITFIRVTDNGDGIAEDDVIIAFERHATSKIHHSEDLNNISTLGFRGEALASISSVSQVELITKAKSDIIGTIVEVNGGEVAKKEEIGCPNGTTIIVKNLFYNTPARLKFLKKDSSEAGQISNYVERLALTHPEISVKFINNNKQIFQTTGNGDVLTAILSVFGKDFAKSLFEINFESNGVKITGYIGKPELSRSTRNYQCIFINNRYIKDKIISSAIDNAYKTLIMVNKYPVAVLYIDINPQKVDVNVHPAKLEVRFQDENLIYDLVFQAVYNAIQSKILIPNISFQSKPEKKELTINNGKKEIINTDSNKSITNIPSENAQKDVVDYSNNDINSKPVVYEKNKSYNVVKVQDNTKSIIKTEQNFEELIPVSEKQEEIFLQNNFKIIGQLFSTYLIVESGEKMFLIDQHAAHERLKYNNLIKKYEKGEISSQSLISPIVIELSLDEFKRVEENIELFTKLGFEAENFGENTFLIRSVPYIFDQNFSKDFFIEIVDLLSDKKIDNLIDLRENIFSTMACKSAIKANEKLSDNEIQELINNILQNKSTLTCPHGRPVIISITKYEIEKMFKRIQ